jgi:hypothetical protein
VERCFGYTARFTDSRDFYIQYKDEFVRRIYNFDSKCSEVGVTLRCLSSHLSAATLVRE